MNIYINDEKYRVFEQGRAIHGSIELIVGKTRRTRAVRVPASWWLDKSDKRRVYTGGKWLGKNEKGVR